jgi:hypothetical protein
LSGNAEWSYFMECRMHNKRKIICQIFIMVLEKKNLRVVCCKQLHWRNGIKELSVSWVKFIVQPRIFEFEPAFFSLFTALKTALRKEDFQCFSSYSNRYSPLYNAKYGVFLKSLNHRKIMHVNIKTECSTLVRNIAVCHSPFFILSFLT